jgi:fatty acid desaturase
MINDDTVDVEKFVKVPEAQVTLGVPATYREMLRQAGIGAEDLRVLNEPSIPRTLFELVLVALSLAAVPVIYAVAPHPLTFVLCFVLSVRNSNCLAQLIHTSDHGALFKNPRLNAGVGNACSYLLGYTRAGHRLAHLRHHLYLNTEKDPDLVWATPQQTSRDLFRAWAHDFLCLSALKRLLQYSQTDKKTFTVKPWRAVSALLIIRALKVMWPVACVQLAVLAAYSALIGPRFYLVFYVLPIMTLYPAQIRLRATVEHSFDVGYAPKTSSDLWVTRSTRARWFERFVFAPYGIHFHFEHHLFPAVPHYNLRNVRELLKRAGLPIPLTPGYIAFVLTKIKSERHHPVTRSAA